MNRFGTLLPLLLVAACSPSVAPRSPVAVEAPAGLCRVGPDGGMPVADRGIGGTGSPAVAGPIQVADRGIGGTGSPSRTGIVGVITGFASVCLAGQEVEYGAGVPVQVDGRASGLEALRAGQVAVVLADGARPVAASLSVRHEVSGPVERMEPDGFLRVAGQRVLPPPGTAVPQAGSWTEVSGFRRADGSILATRLDPRSPGEVLLRGVMRIEAGRRWIGLVEIRPGRFQERQDGVPVVVVGRLNDGVLEADTVEPDALLLDPVAYFGPTVQVLVLEGYADGGLFSFGRGVRFDAPFGSGRALARLERGPAGRFTPAFISPAVGPAGGHVGSGPGPGAGAFGSASRAGFVPAPIPNRGMDRGFGGVGRDGGNGPAGGERRNRERANEQGRRGSEMPGEGMGSGSGPAGGPGGGGFRGPGR